MRLVVSASAAIIKGNKILLAKRSNTEDKFPGCWTFAGGKLDDPADTLAETAVREVKEEIGLDLKNPKMFGFYESFSPDCHAIGHVFIGEASGELKLDPEEVEECGWFSYQETLKLEMAFAYRDVLDDLHHKGFF